MTAVVIGAPLVAPPPPPRHPGWEKIQLTWTDVRGHVWDLTDPEMGVFLVRDGVRGFHYTKSQQYRDQSPAVHGSYYRGLSYEAREFFWPIYLFHDGTTLEWVERDDLWWKGLNPELGEGRLTVRVPGVCERWIDLRFKDDGDWAAATDPAFYGWAVYGITLQADRPHFRSVTPYKNHWDAVEPVDFHGGLTPGAPILNIDSSRTLASASVTNTGDVESYPVWTFNGPFTSASATVDGHTIEVPIALDVDEWIRVDTDPGELTVVDHLGVDRFTDMGEFDPASIPPGAPVVLDLAVTGGAGRIDIEMPLLYNKPWGLG